LGIFSFLRSNKRATLENPSTTITDVYDWLDGGSGKVGKKEALTLSSFYAANNDLGESVAQVPLNIYKRTDSGREIAYDHPLQQLLHREPNGYQTSFVWRHTMQINATCGGNGISQIIRNGRGEAESLIIIPFTELQAVYITSRGTPIYVFEKDGVEREIAGRDILHIPNYAGDGIIGQGWLDTGKVVIKGGVSQNEHSNSVHENSGNLSGVFVHPGKIDDPTRQKLKKEFNSKYVGPGNAGKVAFLEEDMKFHRIPITLQEAQLLESKTFTVEEMSRISRIPQHMLSNLANATFSNIEHQSLEFVRYALLPWIKKWEMELDKKLLREDEKGTYFIKFNLDALQRADIKTRGDFYTKMVNIGAFTRNEVREMENKNNLEGLDEPLQPMNFTGANTSDEDKEKEDGN